MVAEAALVAVAVIGESRLVDVVVRARADEAVRLEPAARQGEEALSVARAAICAARVYAYHVIIKVFIGR